MAIRWAEDWTGLGDAGRAPRLKDLSLGTARVALSAEFRVRKTAFRSARLVRGQDHEQGQLRAVMGASIRFNDHLRLYGELATGQVDAGRDAAPPNVRNQLAVQQLFVEVRGGTGPWLIGALLGRQEFADGPRQLISLGDGPNLHRTWNGVRVYAHAPNLRLGAFDLRATRLGSGAFDESVDWRERLRGVNLGLRTRRGKDGAGFIDLFWLRTDLPARRSGRLLGVDARDTVGLRLWGRAGSVRYDWMAARQSGRTNDGRTIDAWGLFATQGVDVPHVRWSPRLTARLDLASGGSATHTDASGTFHPLYASSSHVGEGQFLGLSNLAMVTPGVTFAPTARTQVALEHGLAWRLREDDAIYGSGMRAYAGTAGTPGRRIGTLSRLTVSWRTDAGITLRLNLEHLHAAEALTRNRFDSGTYGHVDATYHF